MKFLLELRGTCVFLASLITFTASTGAYIGKAESIPSYQDQSRKSEFFDTLPGGGDNGSILDATNPMDLMNRLKRATAMDNATNPSDAIDQALEALILEEEQGLP